jgi:hypothetical protein
MMSFMICYPHQILLGSGNKKNEMGRACGTYGDRTDAYTVLVKKPEVSNHLEDPDIDERIILK